MSIYIHFTDEQKEQARQTDLVDLLRRQGEKVEPSGREYEWLDGSAKVTTRGNVWYHQYEKVGGDAIDFVKKFYSKSYPEAMQYLLGDHNGRLIVSPPIQKEPPPPFVLPPQNDNMRRVYAYLLNKRGIDRNVLYAFTHAGMIYESADYHNAIFVGFDKNNKAVHAHKRGTGSESSYKGNVASGIPECSFHWNGSSDRIYILSEYQTRWYSSCSDSCRLTIYNNITFDSTVIDYANVTAGSEDVITFDITKIAKEWYNGTANNGVLLRTEDLAEISLGGFCCYYPECKPMVSSS